MAGTVAAFGTSATLLAIGLAEADDTGRHCARVLNPHHDLGDLMRFQVS